MEFKLEKAEYIQLNSLLKLMDIAESGGQANQIILDGEVTLNGELVLAKRKKIVKGDTIEVFSTEAS